LLSVSPACRRGISEVEARKIAIDALVAYSGRKHLPPSEWHLREFDDSGKVVDWFYAFESATVPKHIVSVLVNRNGTSETHSTVDQVPSGVR
jgi:hypothetical protein